MPQDPAEPASVDPLMFDSSYAVSSEIEDTLRAASADPSIRGLLIDVDSGGGGSVAGDEIAKLISGSSAKIVIGGGDTIAAIESSGGDKKKLGLLFTFRAPLF